jgi:hypothetical protein
MSPATLSRDQSQLCGRKYGKEALSKIYDTTTTHYVSIVFGNSTQHQCEGEQRTLLKAVLFSTFFFFNYVNVLKERGSFTRQLLVEFFSAKKKLHLCNTINKRFVNVIRRP